VPTETLLAKLQSQFNLTVEEQAAIAAMPSTVVHVVQDQRLHAAGDRPTTCLVVLDGIVSSSRDIEDGKRQIMSFYVKGDLPDIRTLHLSVIDCDVFALSAGRIAVVPHGDLRRLLDDNPRIAAAFWRSTLVVASMYREWIVNIGHRSAVSRLAHLMCELMTRLEAVGLAADGTCKLPLTQAHLSAATGLSAVHLNRTLQVLRQRGLLAFAGGRLTIPDRQALAEVARFRPDYLYLPSNA
jgi:CRP-like cAMP-binding protein